MVLGSHGGGVIRTCDCHPHLSLFSPLSGGGRRVAMRFYKPQVLILSVLIIWGHWLHGTSITFIVIRLLKPTQILDTRNLGSQKEKGNISCNVQDSPTQTGLLIVLFLLLKAAGPPLVTALPPLTQGSTGRFSQEGFRAFTMKSEQFILNTQCLLLK